MPDTFLTAEQRAALFAGGATQVVDPDGRTYYANGTAYQTTPTQAINTTTAYDQYGAGSVTLTDGERIVVWGSQHQDVPDAYGWGVYMQRFDAAGAKVGGETQVNTTTALDQTPFEVLALADGGAMVLWSQSIPFESDREIRGQKIGADGTFSGDEVHIGTMDYAVDDEFAALADGGFVRAGYKYDPTNLRPYTDVYVQIHDGSGTPTTDLLMINPPDRTGHNGNSDVTALSDGSFLVAYFLTEPSYRVEIQRVDSQGVKIGDVRTLPVENSLLSITALENDTYVLTDIVSSNDDSTTNVRAQIYSLDGAAVGAAVQFATIYAPSTTITALTDGSFVMAWQSQTAGTTYYSVAHFDAWGGQIGDIARFDGEMPIFNALADGGYTTTWSDRAILSQEYDVFQSGLHRLDYHTLHSTDDVVTGGPGDTVVVTTPDNLWTGDILTGGAGNDVLELSASGGLDLVFPTEFSGFETVLGTSGDDIFGVSQARLADVTLIDGRGGHDTVSFADETSGQTANLDNALFANIENLTGSVHDDALTGDENANVLTGGAGSDQIYGLSGDDVLIGGSSTHYGILGYIFEGPDYLYGGAGNDTYYVVSALENRPLDVVFEGALFDGSQSGPGDVDTIHLNGQFFWDYYSVGEVLSIDSPILNGAYLVGGKDVADKAIFGSSGTDYISTYGGNATVDAGAGSDAISFSLYGLDESYRGANTVVMKAGNGADYVYDFRSGVDHIDLTAFHFGITGQQVLDQAVNVDNPDTADDYSYFYLTNAGGVDNYIVFMGLLSNQLQAGDFIT